MAKVELDGSVSEPEEVESKQEPTVTEDEDGGVTIRTESPAATTRKQRREDERRQMHDEMAALRRELEESKALSRRAVEEASRPRAEVNGSGAGDPIEKEIEYTRKEMETIQSALRSGSVQSMDEAERLKKRFYELDDKRETLREQRLEERLKRNMPQQADPEVEATTAILRSEFGDVMSNQAAMQWASGEYAKMRAEGKPGTIVTSKLALQRAAEAFGIRNAERPAAAAHQQQRYGSVSAQAGARNTGSEVRLDRDQKKMAVARWPDDDENVAYKKMAELLRKSESA